MKDSIEKGLRASDPEERRIAVSRIPGLPAAERTGALLTALGDFDWRVRKEATAMAVALAPDERILTGLLQAFQPGDNVGLRNAVVEALGGFGASVVPAISATMGSLDADGRKLACEALARCGDPSAVGLLEKLIGDEDPNVRVAAIESLAFVGSSAFDRAASVLRRALRSRANLEVLTTLEAMNQLGVVVEWEALKPLLSDPMLERAALITVGRAAHPDAAPTLVRALAHDESSVWFAALAALASFVSQAGPARQAARAALESLDESARRRVIDVCRRPDVGTEAQKNALLVVGAFGTAGAAVAIDALADDRVAPEAEVALVMLGPAAILELAARAKAGGSRERAACVELLGRLADETTRSTARQAIHDAAADDASPDVVRAALVALAQLGDEGSMGFSIRWLTAKAPSRVRHAAATALAACASRHPEAARALARQARANQPDAAVAAIVMGAVEGHVFGTTAKDVEFLAMAVSNQDALVRRTALDTLGGIESSSALDAVSFALADEVPDVQLAAARALGRMRDGEGRAIGVPRLREAVRDALDDGLALAAINALGDAGDSAALEDLRRIAKEESLARAVMAVESIGRLGGAERYETLVEMLRHSEPEIVKTALRALAADADPRVELHLGASLSHNAWDVRRFAADLLGQWGGESTKRLLRERLAVEDEPLVREAIQRSLAEAEGVVGPRRTVPPAAFGGTSG